MLKINCGTRRLIFPHKTLKVIECPLQHFADVVILARCSQANKSLIRPFKRHSKQFSFKACPGLTELTHGLTFFFFLFFFTDNNNTQFILLLAAQAIQRASDVLGWSIKKCSLILSQQEQPNSTIKTN